MPQEKLVEVLGHRISYVEAGRGEPVVFLHGLGGSTLSWGPNLRALSARYHVYAFDQIGFGRSDKPAISYRISTFVESLLGFMRKVGILRASLVGHSMGGEVVLRFAHGHPEMVDRLALVASAGLRLDPDESGDRVDPAPTTHQGMRALLESLFYDRSLVEDDLIELALETMAGYGDADTIRRYRAIGDNEPPLEEADLGAIRAPALVLWGRHDSLIPLSLGERIARAIPGARLVVIERCGHLPHVEKAREFNSALLGFLEAKE